MHGTSHTGIHTNYEYTRKVLRIACAYGVQIDRAPEATTSYDHRRAVPTMDSKRYYKHALGTPCQPRTRTQHSPSILMATRVQKGNARISFLKTISVRVPRPIIHARTRPIRISPQVLKFKYQVALPMAAFGCVIRLSTRANKYPRFPMFTPGASSSNEAMVSRMWVRTARPSLFRTPKLCVRVWMGGWVGGV